MSEVERYGVMRVELELRLKDLPGDPEAVVLAKLGDLPDGWMVDEVTVQKWTQEHERFNYATTVAHWCTTATVKLLRKDDK